MAPAPAAADPSPTSSVLASTTPRDMKSIEPAPSSPRRRASVSRYSSAVGESPREAPAAGQGARASLGRAKSSAGLEEDGRRERRLSGVQPAKQSSSVSEPAPGKAAADSDVPAAVRTPRRSSAAAAKLGGDQAQPSSPVRGPPPSRESSAEVAAARRLQRRMSTGSIDAQAPPPLPLPPASNFGEHRPRRVSSILLTAGTAGEAAVPTGAVEPQGSPKARRTSTGGASHPSAEQLPSDGEAATGAALARQASRPHRASTLKRGPSEGEHPRAHDLSRHRTCHVQCLEQISAGIIPEQRCSERNVRIPHCLLPRLP